MLKGEEFMYKTKSATPAIVKRNWWIVDANAQVVGRLGTEVASILRGKKKPYFTPHFDCGDFVIVINAEKAVFSGNKLTDKKYIRHTGYPGGQRETTAQELFAKKPEAVIEKAVKGMLPKNKLGRAMFKKMFVYAGPDHPHTAQQPKELKIKS